MTAHSKQLHSTGPRLVAGLKLRPWHTPPCTTEDRLQRIEIMAQRINQYVDFMCQVGSLNGSCVEAKERAVAAFYAQLIVVERELGRIQRDLQLD